MYAIIEDSGTQIKVFEGDVVRVAKRSLAEDAATVIFDRVLMLGEGQESRIGTPLLEGAKVTADIIAEDREKKITIIKFKRRKNYRRKNGHRQDYLEVKVTAILPG
jgi:large subunit ribosomal protein L21